MKKRSEKVCVFLLVALFLLPLAGCGSDAVPDEDIAAIPTAAAATPSKPTPSVGFSLSDMTNITYYTLSEELETVEVTSVLTENTKMSPEELVAYVTATMEDVSVTVRVREVTTQDTSIIVDFESDSVPVCFANERLEGAILDAIAQSLLDNFPEYGSIIFRAGGAAYQSDNRSFDLNYIYMGR